MNDDALIEELKLRIPRNASPEERVELGLILAAWTLDRMMAQNGVRIEQSLHDNRCPEENIVDAMLWAHEHMRDERAVALEKLRVQLVATFYPSCVINGTVH